MPSLKTIALAVAALASAQILAAPVAETTKTTAGTATDHPKTTTAPSADHAKTSAVSSAEHSKTTSAPVATHSTSPLFTSEFDADFCMWSSGFLYVHWAVLVKQWGTESVDSMFSAVESALKGNSACQSYSLMEKIPYGVGAHNTTLGFTFNTDDFCTASTMSAILQKVSGHGDFHCSSDPKIAGDPDLSNLIPDLLGEGADEDPSEEKRKRSDAEESKTASATTTKATGKASKTTAARASTATGSSGTSTGSSDTAHPAGLANLREATVVNGMSIPSVQEMAEKLGLANPSNVTRLEVIEKLSSDPLALSA